MSISFYSKGLRKNRSKPCVISMCQPGGTRYIPAQCKYSNFSAFFYQTKILPHQKKWKWMHEDGIGHILPSYKSAANILASIPATSCSAEQSFSALQRIKTYLWNCLTEDHLPTIAILNIERENTNFIKANQIDEFASRNKTQKSLLLFNE